MKISCGLDLPMWLWLPGQNLMLVYETVQETACLVHFACTVPGTQRQKKCFTLMSLEYPAVVLSLKPIILLLSHTTLSFLHFIDEKPESLRPITHENYGVLELMLYTQRVTLASLLLPLLLWMQRAFLLLWASLKKCSPSEQVSLRPDSHSSWHQTAVLCYDNVFC